ncbi:MAG: universal stress protein [Thermoplasmata archaeon]|nr:universal stress protein [Thermoplasmata archaeon]
MDSAEPVSPAPPPARPLRSIAVAVDGSVPARRALNVAIDLARLSSATLAVVGVVPAPRVYSDSGGAVMQVLAENRREFERILAQAGETARAAGVTHVTSDAREGAIAEELLAFLEERRPDLLVMGARGLSTTGRLLLGSVSDGVVHHARCSVLIVRPPAELPPVAPPNLDRTTTRRKH